MTTLDDVLEEARGHTRIATLLSAAGRGPVAGYWHRGAAPAQSRGLTPLVSVDLSTGPALALVGWLHLLTDPRRVVGLAHITTAPPEALRDFEPLHARTEVIFPSPEQLAAAATPALRKALAGGLRDAYNRHYQSTYPLYTAQADFMLGGWPFEWPDERPAALVGAQFVGCSFRDAEPWWELWYTLEDTLEVVGRVT